ncbi:type II secretion system F family protein [Burkholderia vietnamiensis]|uniref:type II secretion system protein n=1 Tax=Burkholderia vietnamiensis TaxID=60552 RepID=UPI001593CD38|nr:type II secretion system protein [Burkholderia vietnamiensis]MCA8197399.1 type II secretion system protein [Burkholderia vietnamiensis]
MFSMLADFLPPSLVFWWQRMLFSGDERRAFYIQLAMLMRNGAVLGVALKTLHGIYSSNGTKPNRVKAVIAKECMDGLGESSTVPDTLFDWIPYDEYQLIEAGTKADGGVAEALKRAAELVKRKGVMRSTLINKLSYPMVQFAGVIALLYYVALKALPQILKMSKRDQWDFQAYMMDFLAHAVGGYGTIIAAGMVVCVAFMIWSLPNLTGSVRMWFEPFPPWSIMRRIWGATFLYNFALLQSAGRMGRDILVEGIETANPYMAERMQGALVGVKNGKNIGEALFLAGYNFPSREAVEFSRAIAGQEGGQESMMQFTAEWMDQTVEDVSSLADSVSVLVTLFNFAVLVFVLSGASSMGMAALDKVNG